MVENFNKSVRPSMAVKNNGVENKGNFKPSTFAEIRESKTAPVQAMLDKELPNVIGSSFSLVAVDEQTSTDSNTGEVKNSTVYTVRVITKTAKAFRDLIQIKVKNSHSIVKDEELDKLMMQVAKPIVLRFDGIAHYY